MMTLNGYGKILKVLALLGLMSVLLVAYPRGSEAQITGEVNYKWLGIGDLAHQYPSVGSYGLAGGGMTWPDIRISHGVIRGYHDGFRLWLGVKNWTAPDGEQWDYKFSYTERENVDQDVFTREFKRVCRFPQPEVVVDLQPAYREPMECDEIDPNMDADQKIVVVLNTNIGVRLRKEIKQFSQPYHDNYHIIDMTLTNTGNVDHDSEVELPEQDIEGLMLWWDRRWGQTWQTSDVIGRGARWGQTNMHDIVRNSTLKGYFTWQGWSTELQEWNPIGAAAFNSSGGSFVTEQDTSGQLHAIGFAGMGHIHADQSANNSSNDPNQPHTMWWWGANDANATGSPPESSSPSTMQLHYEGWFENGGPVGCGNDGYPNACVTTPTHADSIVPNGDFAHPPQSSPEIFAGGEREALGYGPYDLGPGESVNIVVVEGVDGLDIHEARKIGKKAKRLWEQGNQLGDIDHDVDGDDQITPNHTAETADQFWEQVGEPYERMDKNEWVMTGRDSIFKTFLRAKLNHQSEYDIPREPRPPSRFTVNSAAGGVEMSWEYPGSDPANGFEIYRSESFYQGNPVNEMQYQQVADLPGSARSYKDTVGVERGIDYYYYIQAVGAETAPDDTTALTPGGVEMKSNRYWTQTYIPANSLREPGEELADARVVPNPYHAGQSQNLSYPGAPRLGFLEIPGECTIKIYTERGDLVRTLEHTDGTGDEFWDLQTEAEQPVASGLYIAHIRDHNTGNERVMKFIVIR